MPACPRCFVLALGLLLAAFLGACDTDNPSSPLEELAGLYDFAELRFVPTAGNVAPADVRARLVPSRTSVELFGTGQVLIRFQVEGGTSAFVNGTFTATRSTAHLSAEDEEDAARLATLLLPDPLSLARSADDQSLSASIAMTVNLEAFDPVGYAGLTAVPGRLDVTLQRREE